MDQPGGHPVLRLARMVPRRPWQPMLSKQDLFVTRKLSSHFLPWHVRLAVVLFFPALPYLPFVRSSTRGRHVAAVPSLHLSDPRTYGALVLTSSDAHYFSSQSRIFCCVASVFWEHLCSQSASFYRCLTYSDLHVSSGISKASLSRRYASPHVQRALHRQFRPRFWCSAVESRRRSYSIELWQVRVPSLTRLVAVVSKTMSGRNTSTRNSLVVQWWLTPIADVWDLAISLVRSSKHVRPGYSCHRRR